MTRVSISDARGDGVSFTGQYANLTVFLDFRERSHYGKRY